jgi:hypothetical protein
MRLLKYLGVSLAINLGSGLVGAMVSAATASEGIGLLAQLALLIFISAQIASRVGYRSRDAFLIFLPYPGWVWTVKWVWRLVSLPDRYWEHDDEMLAEAERLKQEAQAKTYAERS